MLLFHKEAIKRHILHPFCFKNFYKHYRNDAFWKDEDTMECLSDDAHRLWFLKELGLGSNSHFCEAIGDLLKCNLWKVIFSLGGLTIVVP